MSTPAAGQPPFALDGTVTRDKLVELLAVQTELATLDYKRACDLSGAAGTVELIKDIGAMGILGGYLVVGADDQGNVTGVPAGQAAHFDQATLSAKAGRYLPTGLELRSAVHTLDNGSGPCEVALVWVAPHPDGWCVFTREGAYTDPTTGKNKTAFRAGQVYARHGTASEPWNQGDIAAARTALVAREKDAWRAEHAEETRRALQAALSGASIAAGPSDAFTWQLDAAGFETAAVELLRGGDDVPVRRMLRTAVRNGAELAQDGSGTAAAELTVLLDRLAVVAALAMELHRPAFLAMATGALLALYDWAVESQYLPVAGPGLPLAQLWLQVAERLYALGGLAVRLQDWQAVRSLALARVPALDREQRSRRPWHRHALTEASRARLLQPDATDHPSRALSLLLFARATAAADPMLHPDLTQLAMAASSRPDALLRSLCQFDLLVTVLAGAHANATTPAALAAVSYPNYARVDECRADEVARLLVQQAPSAPGVRAELLPGVTDSQLALLLDLADRNAQAAAQGVWGWEGYQDEQVLGFIRTHLPRA